MPAPYPFLVNERRIAGATYSQALCAFLFLYKKVSQVDHAGGRACATTTRQGCRFSATGNHGARRKRKGGKDRLTTLPLSLVMPLRGQIDRARTSYEEDRLQSRNGVMLPGALDRKYPKVATSWKWFSVFPSEHASVDLRSEHRQR
jgi:hypothetical protein